MPLVPGEYRLVYSGDVKIYENLDVLPMADILFNWQYIQDEDEAVTIMAGESFDPESTAVILGAGLAAPGTGEGAVQITSYQPEQIRLRVETNSPALVRLRESFYPGWRATIDGESVAVLKTDSLFRGVFVPEGTHIVELVFSPMSYRAGTILSALGVTVWLILLFYAYLLPVTSHIWRRETPRD
jgi:hypothetical protein